MKSSRPQSQQPIPSHAKKIFSGILIDVYQWEQEQFDGTFKTFEKVKRKFDTVTVIPITQDGKMIITEQEQPGTEPFIGFPGGIVEIGEEITDAAERELLEETGYMPETLIPWDAKHPFTKTEWVLYTYIAKGCKKVSDPRPDCGEKIKLKLITFDEFLHIVAQTNFRDSEIALKVFQTKEQENGLEKLIKLFSPALNE